MALGKPSACLRVPTLLDRCDQLAARLKNRRRPKGYSLGWGLGRHVLGSHFFHYVRNPWGSYAEYSCDIDFIPADVDWQSGDHDGEDAFYVWGPNPPDDFAVNFDKG